MPSIHTAEGLSDPLARHSLSARELQQMLALERTGEPFLAMRDGDGGLHLVAARRRTQRVDAGARRGYGRVIPWDAEVSGLHAELRRLGEEWTVRRRRAFAQRDVPQRRAGRRPSAAAPGRPPAASDGRSSPTARSATDSSERTVASGNLPELPRLSETQRRILVALCRPYGEGASSPCPRATSRSHARSFSGRCRQAPPAHPVRELRPGRASAEPEAGRACRARAADSGSSPSATCPRTERPAG